MKAPVAAKMTGTQCSAPPVIPHAIALAMIWSLL
jgi:hypothetical protein